jgi:hypothetical protein
MRTDLQPFSVVELAVPALIILMLGFAVSFLVTRKPHWSLFVAGVKASLFIIYYGVLFDGTFSFLDDWTYLEHGKRLVDKGVSFANLFGHWPELSYVAGDRHFVYYLYNADSIRLLGSAYYAPVTLNIALTFVAAGFMAAAARGGLGFSSRLATGLFLFFVIHPDVLSWSTIMNGKDTLVLAGTALAVYAVSLFGRRRYVPAVLLGLAVGTVLFFTRFYVPLLLLAALFGATLLSPAGGRRPGLWLLVPAGLAAVVSILGVDGLMDAYSRFQADFVNPIYGIPRMLLTPIPFHTTEHYAFLDLPQVFHWAMLPALAYGAYRMWRLGTITARFVVLYFLLMLGLYGMFGELQGPRHRYQFDGLIALFQFYGGLGILKQILPASRSLVLARPGWAFSQ